MILYGNNGHVYGKVGTSICFGVNPVGPYVTIGNQTWTTTNLAYDDGGDGITSRNLPNVNGYDLGTQYYYTWSAAMRVADSIEGWHLPTSAEYRTLLTYAGGVGTTAAGAHLRATSAWNYGRNGTDDYGFNWLPAGQNTTADGWDVAGLRGCLWMSANKLASNMLNCYCNVNDSNKGKAATGNAYNGNYLSVRLVKDT